MDNGWVGDWRHSRKQKFVLRWWGPGDRPAERLARNHGELVYCLAKDLFAFLLFLTFLLKSVMLLA